MNRINKSHITKRYVVWLLLFQRAAIYFCNKSDGTLLQRKYIRNNVELSKTDYLRGVEYKNNTLEAVYHNDGRVIKDGTSWIYEYSIKDHLGNVRETFSDDDGDGEITGT